MSWELDYRERDEFLLWYWGPAVGRQRMVKFRVQYMNRNIPWDHPARGVLEMLDIYMREHSRPPKEQPPIFVDNPMFAIGKGNRVKPPAEYVVHKVIAMLSPALENDDWDDFQLPEQPEREDPPRPPSPIDLTFDDSDDDWQAYEERQESVEEPDAPRIEALVIEDEEEYGAQDGDLGGMDGDDGADYGFDLPFDSEASPEPALHPLRSPSLELRAPFVQDDDATPATSASPATDTKAKPSLKRKAVKSSAPPAKRRKRPAVKAVKSRVLRPTRKPLDEERPELNKFHETHLYINFNLPVPNDRKSRAAFGLNFFELRRRGGGQLVSLQELGTSKAGDIVLRGVAGTLEDLAQDKEGNEVSELAHEYWARPPPKDDSSDGGQVLVAAFDLLGITLQLDGIYIETRHARYRLHHPSEPYCASASAGFAQARRLLQLYLVGREHHVLGQHKKGWEVVLDDLNAVLVEHSTPLASAQELLHTAWRSSSSASLAALDHDDDIDARLAEILEQHLPNTPYVTPFVFDLVRPYLQLGMIRTDPEHDASSAEEARAEQEALYEDIQQEVVDFSHCELRVTSSVKGVAKSGRSSAAVDPHADSSRIEIFHETSTKRGDVRTTYKKGEMVLVMGTSPFEVAQETRAQGKGRKVAAEVVEDEVVEDDFDFAGEQTARKEDAEDADLALSHDAVPWFGRIAYFFRVKGDKAVNVHINWLLHRRSTRLGAHAQATALVKVDQCDNVDLLTVVRHVDVARVTAGMDPPLQGLYYDFAWDKSTDAYLDFESLEDEAQVDWTRLDRAQVPRCTSCARRAAEAIESIKEVKDIKNPDSSQSGDDNARLSVPVWVEKKSTFLFHDVEYHIGDLVYILPAYIIDPAALTRQPLLVGRLLAVNGRNGRGDSTLGVAGCTVKIQFYQRFDDLFIDPEGSTDPLRLVTNNVVNEGVDIQRLHGRALLLHRSEMLALARQRYPSLSNKDEILSVSQALLEREEDVFYCSDELALEAAGRLGLDSAVEEDRVGDPPTRDSRLTGNIAPFLESISRTDAPAKMSACRNCKDAFEARLEREQEAKHDAMMHPETGKIPALSLYSGADCFSTGVRDGCPVVEVKAAVELDPIAAAACKSNHPVMTMYDVACSDVLEAAVNDQKVTIFASDRERQIRPPPIGDVDLILAGAPCQGFSSANMHKRDDDLRCAEPYVYLAFMDLYRPSYSFFENVRDIQRFALPEDAEKGGLLKILVEGLLRLGYQVRADVFNAACFGAPQSRRRLILTVARRGLVLPGAPQPTHAYTPALTGLARGKWDSGAREHAPSTTRRLHGHAPHHPVTIWDAIADLPAFGFADPFGVVQHANFEKRGLQAWERGVPIGFGDEGKPREYAAPPQSAYQRRSRIRFGASKVEFAKVVTDHVVPAVAELTASRLAHLKAVDGKGKDHGKGNYKDITPVIPDPYSTDGKLALQPDFPPALPERRYPQWWKRLQWQDLSTCLRTTIKVDGTSHGPRIHPRDPRQISVREAARIQGFPDGDRWKDYDETALAAQLKMIGNAVPLPLGAALGRELFKSILRCKEKTGAIKYGRAEDEDEEEDAEMVGVQGAGAAPRATDSDSDSDDEIEIVECARVEGSAELGDDEGGEGGESEEEEDDDDDVLMVKRRFKREGS